MAVPQANVDYLWNVVVNPRLGDFYVWGGSFDRNNPSIGTDCSGAVSAALCALLYGPGMPYQRQFWTGTFAGVNPGDHGPFGGAACTSNLVCIAGPDLAPSDAAMIIAVRQHSDPGDSHMICQVGGITIEMGGNEVTPDGIERDYHTNVTNPNCSRIDDTNEFNQWFYLPGPVSVVNNTFFADVSEFQVPVDDSYPYRVISIRSNDGTYHDHHFPQNYQWCVKAADDGRLDCFIVYAYWRPDWQGTAQTMIDMVTAQGGPHPKMVAMIDLESGGNPDSDQSTWVNGTYMDLAGWLGNPARVIGYANIGDERTMWQAKPQHLEMIIAAYGSNPPADADFQKLAHQYTDGQAAAGGLPTGCPPFNNCDMNVADNLTPVQFAELCGVGVEDFMAALSADEQRALYDKIMAYPEVPSIGGRWPSRSIYRDSNDGIDDTVGMVLNIDATTFDLLTEWQALLGVPEAVGRVKRLAEGQGPAGQIQSAVDRAKFIVSKLPAGS